MVNPKLSELVGKLLDKTERNEIRWEKTSEPGVFQCAFPEYAVRIGSHKNPYKVLAPDECVLSIYDSEGTKLEDVDASQVFVLRPDGRDALTELHRLARRSALGVEKAIDDILSAL